MSISLASAGTPVASIGANSSAMGQLPGLHGAPFNAVGNGGATATGNSNTGSVSTHARDRRPGALAFQEQIVARGGQPGDVLTGECDRARAIEGGVASLDQLTVAGIEGYDNEPVSLRWRS